MEQKYPQDLSASRKWKQERKQLKVRVKGERMKLFQSIKQCKVYQQIQISQTFQHKLNQITQNIKSNNMNISGIKQVSCIKMHESQQYKRANLSSMTPDSMNSSLSKISQKKNLFYKHEDHTKLNYYARFSPNRKKIDEEFESCVREGVSPLSPRSGKSSSAMKKSRKERKSEVKNQENIEDVEHEKFELIDEGILLVINEKHSNRSQIYIDEEEQVQEIQEYKQKSEINKKLFTNNSKLTEISQESIKNVHVQPPNNNCKNQSSNQQSESQQSSQFERMIEPSSSDQNQIIYVPKVSTGLQMRIEDQESDEEPEYNYLKQGKESSGHILIFDGSQQKIFELAKSIGSVKVQKNTISENREVKSENVSFSIDSDLSLIEQRWNSYFEADHDDKSSENSIHEKKPLFGENVSEISHTHKNEQDYEVNPPKISQTSDYELPSFSNPNSSNYITPQSSQHESLNEGQHNDDNQKNENEKKEFKRQYTFGNELNTAFSNEEGLEAEIQNKKSVPLFMKFMSKETISSFSKSKVLNAKKIINTAKKQQSKAEIVERQKISKILEPRLNLSKKITNETQNTEKQQQKIVSGEQNQIAIISKPFTFGQILIEEDPNEQDSQFELKKSQSDIRNPNSQIKSDILIEEDENFCIQVTFKVQNIKREDFSTTKLYEKAKKRSVWQKTMRSMLEKQRKKKEKLSDQNLLNSENLEIQASDIQSNLPEIRVEQDFFDEPFLKVEEKQRHPQHEQLTGYAKIYSKKRFYTGKAKTQTFQEKLKPTQSHYQSSEKNDSASEDADESHPKKSEKQSLTTATEQIGHNFYSQTYPSPKRKSNGIQQVQNLKKYLKKIEESSKNDVNQEAKQVNLETNQSLEELETEKSSLPQNMEEGQLKNNKQDGIKISQKNQQKEKEIQTLRQFKDQPEKIFHLKNQTMTIKKKTHFEISQIDQSKQTQTFEKSLQMLQNVIPSLPHEMIPVYENIYIQVYQQQLNYHKRIKRQIFLLNFMEQFVKGEKEKIDCEGFLSSLNYASDFSSQPISGTDEQELQIFVNKHIILSLVRKLASSF